MLAPLRRSLGERILESSVHSTICKRAIHVQNPIRGAAAAQVQLNDDYIIQSIKQLKPENAPKNPPRLQQKFKSPPSPIKSQQKGKSSPKKAPASPPPAVVTPTVATPENTPSILATATQMSSPFLWNTKNILSLYPEPFEKLLPPEVEIVSRKSSRIHRWRNESLQFLEQGLKLILKIDYISLEKAKRGKGFRVRIHANWAKHIGIAIGDGPTKVHFDKAHANDSKRPLITLHCISF
jgi:hypothetical protein